MSIRSGIYTVIGVPIQLEGEWQANECVAVVDVIANVRRAGHDTAADLTYNIMVCRRAAFYGVIPREGRINIASISGDRAGANARSHATSEIEVHGEAGSHVAVHELDSGHAASSIAGQGQIARLDRPCINRLVEVHVIVIVARCWRRERAANWRVSRGHH